MKKRKEPLLHPVLFFRTWLGEEGGSCADNGIDNKCRNTTYIVKPVKANDAASTVKNHNGTPRIRGSYAPVKK